MLAADRLLRALAAEGVTRLFGNPGSTELPLIDALGRQSRVRYVLGLTETAVMGMADGYAQAGGGLGVVNVHVQPGIANALAGVLNASRARVPMLITVGQQVTGLLDQAPFLGGDVLGPVRPWARWCGEVTRTADLPRMLACAVRAARTPPCGPAVLSLPMDVLAADAPAGAPAPGDVPRAPAPPAQAVRAAAAVLAAARAPVVLAGDGVWHEGASEALAELARRCAAPVWTEPMAAGVPLAWSDPLWMGQLPPFAAQIRAALDGHDVVLALGMPVFRVFGHSHGPALPPDARLLHADVDATEVGRTLVPEVGLVGSVGDTLRDLLRHLPPAGDAALSAACGRVASARAAARAAVPAGAGSGIDASVFARAVAGAVGTTDVVVDESLTSGRALRTLMSDRVPGTWFAHRGSALGWGLPAAVGVALALPERRVMALQGDGGLMFGVHALWTAARHGATVALVVADNGGYEILRAGMEGLTGRREGTWPGLALGRPDLDIPGICRGFGASVDAVAHADALPEALRALWHRAEDGPAVLVVRVRGGTPAVGSPLRPGPSGGEDEARDRGDPA